MRRTRDRTAQNLGTLERWFLHDKRALHGLSLCRILAGVAVLGLLATSFSHRSMTFGPGSGWMDPYREGGGFWETGLVDGLGPTGFTVFYVAVMVLALLYAVGWRTKLVGPLMLVGWVAIVEHGAFLGDQGDNVLRIGLILVLFAETSEHWSLDARRRRTALATPSSGGLRHVLEEIRHSRRVAPLWLGNAVHNIALVALAAQLVIIYVAAGMYKVQGELWQDGTALYYPLQLPQYQPFPLLTDVFTRYGVVVGVATYAAVFIQLFFAPLLLNRITRRIALVLVILLHLGIAVLMALPWFSLSMVAFDAIFVSTSTYVAIERWLASVRRHRPRPGARTAPARRREPSAQRPPR